ncbi:MAG: ATPase [Daejeonella sp.]|nr:ATPase [Daejeonella sp.]
MATNISTISIKAPVQTVWDVLTKPEFIKQWQYGSELLGKWEVGRQIRFRTAWEDKVFEQWGKVLEVRENELLKYSLFAPRPGLEDKPENYFEMSYKLTPQNGEILLEIIQEDNRPGAIQEEPQGTENPILTNLKTIAEALTC